jgi:hypothetical protein
MSHMHACSVRMRQCIALQPNVPDWGLWLPLQSNQQASKEACNVTTSTFPPISWSLVGSSLWPPLLSASQSWDPIRAPPTNQLLQLQLLPGSTCSAAFTNPDNTCNDRPYLEWSFPHAVNTAATGAMSTWFKWDQSTMAGAPTYVPLVSIQGTASIACLLVHETVAQ